MFIKTLVMFTALLGGGLASGPNIDSAAAQPADTAKPARLSADEVVDKVQKFYVDTKQLRAKFKQTVTNKTFGRTTDSLGIVYIKKPGKMRWDYRSKRKKNHTTKSFISDGKQLWAVFNDDKQLFKKDLKKDLLPVAITFLTGQGDLSRDFDAELDTSGKYGKKTDYVLKLEPKQPSASYKNLWLVVDPSNFRVTQSIVLNSKGDTNQFRFYEPDTSKSIADKYFVFNQKKYKDYRLVDPK